MKPLGKMRRHLQLVHRMARTSRTDLAGAAEEGRLRQKDWAGMVTTCRSCDWADRCPEWLDAHQQDGACPPGTCLNKERFEQLRAAQKDVNEVP